MKVIFISAILILGSIISLVIGWKLRHGKWLRFMAGNTFPTISEDKQRQLAKIAGTMWYVVATFPLCLLLIISQDTIEQATMVWLILLSMTVLIIIPVIMAIFKASRIK